MESFVLATLIGFWLALLGAATFVPFFRAAGTDRDAAPSSLSSRHRNVDGGTRAA